MSPRMLLPALALAGCAQDLRFDEYYADRSDPEIRDVTPARESGNIGGQTIAIVGSGFGSEADVVVLIGNHNAEILSVEDGEIHVRTPRGPITGGAADIVVATATGWSELPDAYTYDVSGEVDLYEGETAYIAVQNLWTSCYAGQWNNPETEGSGCEDVAWVGYAGITGASEWYRAPYPRIHLSEFQLVSGSDYSPGGWYFDGAFSASYPSGVEGLRFRPTDSEEPRFRLRNPLWTEDAQDDADACAYVANPDDPDEVDCVKYDLSVMEFCEGVDPVEGGDYRYIADWPVEQNFFNANPEDPDAPESNFSAVDVYLDLPAQQPGGDDSARLRLPGIIDTRADQGMGTPELWTLQSFDDCLDGDGDGQARLDEEGVVFSWTPIAEDLAGESEGVEATQSWVQISVSVLPFGWFGRSSSGPRASITVPDDNLLDPETGRASVGIPNSVLYSFPTLNGQWATTSTLTGKGTLGDYEDNAAYLLVEVYRVTDYRIQTASGPLVFSYETGDFTLQGWEHPLERPTCRDCFDGDGDGWSDELDPDCDEDHGGNGADEVNATSAYSCNDGRDNNGDGLTDAEDPLCSAGWDGETTCGDSEDNDADGWLDAEDPDCMGDPDASEDGGLDPTLGCNDGVDNDGDGWVDVGDPGCAEATGDEADGFSGTACNDGVDNDGHGDADAADPYCAIRGAFGSAEAPTYTNRCLNDTDDDSDDYVDANDPDCEYVGANEYQLFAEEGEELLIPACYDGLDNDGDGSTDAEDPACWVPGTFEPDGFLSDEGASSGTGCTDGADEDGDGWLDGEDPDCVARDAGKQAEIGFGLSVCNNGLDDNEDGKIDAESSYCKDAEGGYEGP